MATDNPEAAGLIYLNLYSVIKASHNNSNHLQLPFKAALEFITNFLRLLNENYFFIYKDRSISFRDYFQTFLFLSFFSFFFFCNPMYRFTREWNVSGIFFAMAKIWRPRHSCGWNRENRTLIILIVEESLPQRNLLFSHDGVFFEKESKRKRNWRLSVSSRRILSLQAIIFIYRGSNEEFE